MTRAPLVVACALAATLAASPAQADVGRDADRLFEEGKQLFDRGSFAAACSRFEASLTLQPGIGARLWLADCYESLGRTASAQRQFQIAAEEARRAGDRREQVAQKRAEGLEPRVVKILVDVQKPIEAERVDVDGVTVTPSSEPSPVSVDPGRHLVTATAPGRTPWQLTFDALAAGRAVTVVVPELAAGNATPSAPARTAQTADAAAALPGEPPPSRSPSSQRIAGIVVAGAGTLSLAVGAILAVVAVRDNDSSKQGCSATCTPEAHDQRTRAISEANGATVGFAVGGALLAGGAALYFFAPTPQTQVAVVPSGVVWRQAF